MIAAIGIRYEKHNIIDRLRSSAKVYFFEIELIGSYRHQFQQKEILKRTIFSID